MDRMESLLNVVKTMIHGGFTGIVKINFTQGSIGRVEKIEELEEGASLVEIRNWGKSKERRKGTPEQILLDVRKSSLNPFHDPQTNIGSLFTKDVHPFRGDGM